jgi:hypothetical protein
MPASIATRWSYAGTKNIVTPPTVVMSDWEVKYIKNLEKPTTTTTTTTTRAVDTIQQYLSSLIYS